MKSDMLDLNDCPVAPLVTKKSRGIFAEYIGEVTVSPREQSQLPLGTFTEAKPPKGFSVEFSPSPVPEESAVSQIAVLRAGGRYELMLQVANFGSSTLTAKVWGL